VLYVTSSDAFLAKDGENVVVKIEDQEAFRSPIHYLEGIVTFGYKGASPAMLRMCSDHNVAVSFLTGSGRFQAQLTGPVKGNVLLRRTQYRLADNLEESTRLSARFIMGKLANSRNVVRRFMSDHCSPDYQGPGREVSWLLAINLGRLERCRDLDEIRGIEGESARAYFSVIDDMILCNKDHFYMRGRSKRPPLDNVNALLSFLYTLLAHEVRAALETVGLDPFVGFLHRDRPGRPGLALDLMEELRAYIADRMVLSLINRGQITGGDFVQKETGGIILKPEGRKTVLEAWQKRKADEITHPFLEEKIPIGLLPYVQAMLLARHIRGDIEDYPPFFWK